MATLNVFLLLMSAHKEILQVLGFKLKGRSLLMGTERVWEVIMLEMAFSVSFEGLVRIGLSSLHHALGVLLSSVLQPTWPRKGHF